MDGNGRWAKKHGVPKLLGHKQGAETARHIIEACPKLSITHLTIYAFSSENWNRPAEEVSNLMSLLKFYLGAELDNLHKNNIKIKIIGDIALLDKDIQERIIYAEELTKNNNALHLNVALNYGSRQEIINAVKNIADKVKEGGLEPEQLNENIISQYLYTAGIPDPDLLIRTSGELRISNFLLWQIAYTELYFSDKLWPDFGVDDLEAAVEAFKQRDRRFGGVSDR
jgi:undecaprenyl diphosphate synthase